MDAVSEGASTAVDQSLLIDILEKRELLEDARSPKDVTALKHSNDAILRDLVAQLGLAFGSGTSKLAEARLCTIKLQYYTKLSHEIDDWLLRAELSKLR